MFIYTLSGAASQDLPGHDLRGRMIMSRGQTQLPGRGVGRVTMLRISEARVKDPGADLVLRVEEERGPGGVGGEQLPEDAEARHGARVVQLEADRAQPLGEGEHLGLGDLLPPRDEHVVKRGHGQGQRGGGGQH